MLNLRLSHPQYDPTGEAEIKADWYVILEHPVSAIDQHSSTPPSESEVHDLPLEKLDQEEITGESEG